MTRVGSQRHKKMLIYKAIFDARLSTEEDVASKMSSRIPTIKGTPCITHSIRGFHIDIDSMYKGVNLFVEDAVR